jgi:hypothetical protein
LALRQAQPKHPRHGVYVHRTKAGAIRYRIKGAFPAMGGIIPAADVRRLRVRAPSSSLRSG